MFVCQPVHKEGGSTSCHTHDAIGQSQVTVDLFLPSTLMAMPFPDMFKCVHYETHTSVGKGAVGIRLKCLLVVCVPTRDSCAFVLSECLSPRGISVHQTSHAEYCYVINSTCCQDHLQLSILIGGDREHESAGERKCTVTGRVVKVCFFFVLQIVLDISLFSFI